MRATFVRFVLELRDFRGFVDFGIVVVVVLGIILIVFGALFRVNFHLVPFIHRPTGAHDLITQIAVRRVALRQKRWKRTL